MKKTDIDLAVKEAKEFIKRAKEVESDYTSYGDLYGSKNSGALRRQSMELTRALAKMRASK